MTQHTPGPWIQDLSQQIQFLDTDNRIENVVEIMTLERDATSCYSTIDNACLIAAAPELLEALESIASSFDACLRSPTSAAVWQEVAASNRRFARAAIAKATGKE